MTALAPRSFTAANCRRTTSRRWRGLCAWAIRLDRRARARRGRSQREGHAIFWSEGQASALDSRDIDSGKEVGTIRVQGCRSGKDLPHDVMFAFAFHAFFPDGTWMLGN